MKGTRSRLLLAGGLACALGEGRALAQTAPSMVVELPPAPSSVSWTTTT